MRFEGKGHQLSEYVLGRQMRDLDIPLLPHMTYVLDLSLQPVDHAFWVILTIRAHRRDQRNLLHRLRFISISGGLRLVPTLETEMCITNPKTLDFSFTRDQAHEMLQGLEKRIRAVGFRQIQADSEIVEETAMPEPEWQTFAVRNLGMIHDKNDGN